MTFTPIQSVFCQRCGQPHGVLYETKIPTRGAKLWLFLIGIAVIAFTWFYAIWYEGQKPALSGNSNYMFGVLVISIIVTAAVVVFLRWVARPRTGQIVVCSACRAWYVLSEAPSMTCGWDVDKIQKELAKNGI